MTEKLANGNAFVFYRTSSACKPMAPASIAELAKVHDIPTSIVPAYAGDRAQVSRAIAQGTSSARKAGWALASYHTDHHEVLYSILRLDKDHTSKQVRPSYADSLRWSDEGGNGMHIEGSHPVARDIDGIFQGLRGMVCPGDWTEAITEYVKGACQGFAFKENGHVYVVPSRNIHLLDKLQAFLAQVGISLVVVEVEPSVEYAVQDAAAESIAGELQKLQDAVAAFDGTQKPSNYRARVQEITELRKRATVYKETLQIAVDEYEAVLQALGSQVSRMLDIRENTTIPRGAGKSAPVTPVAAQDYTPVPQYAPVETYTPPASFQATATVQATFHW